MFEGIVGGHEFFAGREIDTVGAGPFVRRATDAHVDFFRARLAQGAHPRAGGRAADDRVVHHDDAFARRPFP